MLSMAAMFLFSVLFGKFWNKYLMKKKKKAEMMEKMRRKQEEQEMEKNAKKE